MSGCLPSGQVVRAGSCLLKGEIYFSWTTGQGFFRVLILMYHRFVIMFSETLNWEMDEKQKDTSWFH